MSEDLKTLGLKTMVEETNRKQINRLCNAVQKDFEILEFLEKALGVTSHRHDDELIKLSLENDLTQLQPQELVTNETDSQLDYKKDNTTEELIKQKDDLALLKPAVFIKSKNLIQRSHKLKAISQQLTARSRELKIISEDLLARSCSARESKYYKLSEGAP